ncbi:Sugar/inositol transporter [Trema orientale]|uniref:Sugar/inositol transporter n=1 Tax=Trema orientale TaxID=63057 RepID=A0A2P5CQ33_TREOI|nr:Sugar/inositol transporter [Trema orientale]
MKGAVLAAIVAAIGNLLQGWDNSVIAGSIIYIKKEFQLESSMEGLVVAMSLVGGTFITTFSGAASDQIGRRPMLIISSVLFFISGLVMLWAPNVYVLLLARLLNGFATGLVVTQVPVYISETAPSDIRGTLNTLPQFTGSGGMFLSYCMVFGMSLMKSPSWRLMLGVLCLPSLVYLALTIFYLPESPRWLVSKGRMAEAKQVLQRIRDTTDVSGELALLVEGLGTGGEISMEEYIIGPANDLIDPNHESNTPDKDHIRIYGPDSGQSWVAKPVETGRSLLLVSHQGSLVNLPTVDPLVTLFGSVHEKLHESTGGSLIFQNLSNYFTGGDHQSHDHQSPNQEEWDEENQEATPQNDDGEDYEQTTGGGGGGGGADDDLRSPLLSRETTNFEKSTPPSHVFGARRNSSLVIEGNAGEVVSSCADIGGGWQLAWKWCERVGEDGKKEGELQRIYLHQEAIADPSRAGSIVSVPAGAGGESEMVPVAALVGQSAIGPKGGCIIIGDQPSGGIEPAVIEAAAKDVVKGTSWRDLSEPGVRRALIVGIGLQILQQMSGINGVLYYAPQILEQAGVAVLLSNLGMSAASSSLFISAITTFLMLPCIATSMRLMDISGRRSLLLSTIPILIVSLILLVIGSVFNFGPVMDAIISTPSVVVYLCCFVMGFGAIPNILCAEIFPTRVRGLCIAICALTYWISNIIITYSFPLLFKWIGLAGVFSIYTVGCIISWIFVYLKVPETKGMPLEVISEFFALHTTQAADPAEPAVATSNN